MKHVYTITGNERGGFEIEYGKCAACGRPAGRVYFSVHDILGRITEADAGKRVYLNEKTGTLSVENDEQRDARKAEPEAPAAERGGTYTVYVERDTFADPERYPDGIAWRSGIRDENGEEIDGEGDLPDYETARSLALSTLERLI